MKILVTGGGGFLGRCIVGQLLARGDEVRSLARGQQPGVEAIQGDIRDADVVARACSGVDAVIHTAALAGIWGPWELYYSVNTLGTQHVVDACKRHGVSRVVYCSTPSVTFNGGDQVNVDESAPYSDRWLCHYPHSKALAEQYVLDASRRGELLACALRPHLIWGPRDKHLIPRLLNRARQGKLIRVGDGKNLIDMVYVENAASAHVQALDALGPGSPVNGRAYFISQGSPVNCWEWINEILALAKLPPVRKSIAFTNAWRLGAALEAIYSTLRIRSEPRMTRFLAAQLAKDHYFNIRRAKQDFAYLPAISTEEGMRRLSDWLKQEGG